MTEWHITTEPNGTTVRLADGRSFRFIEGLGMPASELTSADVKLVASYATSSHGAVYARTFLACLREAYDARLSQQEHEITLLRHEVVQQVQMHDGDGGMLAATYQRQAMATAAPLLGASRLLNAAIGIVGEGGELAEQALIYTEGDEVLRAMLRLAVAVGAAADLVKKGRHHGHQIDRARIEGALQSVVNRLIAAMVAARDWSNEAPPVAWADESDLGVASRQETRNEIGDLQWYVALAADSIGLPLHEVMQGNLDKLQRRYGGSFSTAASEGRAEGGQA